MTDEEGWRGLASAAVKLVTRTPDGAQTTHENVSRTRVGANLLCAGRSCNLLCRWHPVARQRAG